MHEIIQLIGIISKGILDIILLALYWYLSHPTLLQQSYKALLYFQTHFQHWFLSIHVIASSNLAVYDYAQYSHPTSPSAQLYQLHCHGFSRLCPTIT